MKQELEEKLVKEFPKLYADYKGDPRQTCMAFGFECGDGWYELIYNLSKVLEGKTTAVQVKEKFGGLRFYVTAVTDEIEQAINDAEERSYKICERCGKPGKPDNFGWIRTLCEECRDARTTSKNRFQ